MQSIKSIWPEKKLTDGVLVCLGLSVWREVQMICIWPSWCHYHPIISCFTKIQIGLNFLVSTSPGCPGKRPINEFLSYNHCYNEKFMAAYWNLLKSSIVLYECPCVLYFAISWRCTPILTFTCSFYKIQINRFIKSINLYDGLWC